MKPLLIMLVSHGGAVYANFANKEALFLALVDHCLAEQEQTLRNILQQETSFQTQILATSRWYPQFLEHPQDWLVLATEFWLHATRHPEIQAELALRYRTQRRSIADLLLQAYAVRGRSLPAPAEQLAEAIVALLTGLAMRTRIDADNFSETLAPTMLTLLLDNEEHPKAGQGSVCDDVVSEIIHSPCPFIQIRSRTILSLQ